MSRDNHIRLSDREVKLIEEVREAEFGSHSVPLGEAVEVACVEYLDGN